MSDVEFQVDVGSEEIIEWGLLFLARPIADQNSRALTGFEPPVPD